MIGILSNLLSKEAVLWLAGIFLVIYAMHMSAKAQEWELKYTQLASQLDAKTHELARYKAQRPQVIKRVVTKYNKVPTSTQTCEDTLNSAKKLLKEFAR